MNSLGGFYIVLMVFMVLITIGVVYGVTKEDTLYEFRSRDELVYDRRVLIDGDTVYVYKLKEHLYE